MGGNTISLIFCDSFVGLAGVSVDVDTQPGEDSHPQGSPDGSLDKTMVEDVEEVESSGRGVG